VPATPQLKFTAILLELCRHNVDFIVVGGVAAVLEGAPVNTFDLDVVHSREQTNIARILKALDSLQAFYRTQPARAPKPDASHLSSSGHHQLLMTRFGPLDVLGSIGRLHGYEDLLPHATELELGEGLRVRVLNLEKLIAIKEEIGGEKDAATLPILRRTLQEKRKF
jgi:hypothetical protein